MTSAHSSPGGLSADLDATVTRCAGAVRHVAARHGLSGSDVDEVFQEVRIRLWRSLKSGEKIRGIPASYVYRTAASAALDIIRRRRARPEEELDPTRESGSFNPVAPSDPAADLAEQETADLVSEAVDGLIETRRPVVRMHLAGYKLEEIADLLGWTVAKTRNLLYRGMDDLREGMTRLNVRPGELT